MKLKAFSLRNAKELIRDPLSLIFGTALPVFLLVLISYIQKSVSDMVEINIFKIEVFTPGIAVFSFSFISLFSGLLIAKDRSTSFLTRLFASPLTGSDYILGYSLPLLPLAMVQGVLCFAAALCFGLPVNINLLWAIVALIPSAIMFIGMGLLVGTLCSDKQVGAIASIIVQIAALSSGMWFDLEAIGGGLKTVCYLLPFAHAVDIAEGALAGSAAGLSMHLCWVMGYTVLVFVLAVFLFRKRMKN